MTTAHSAKVRLENFLNTNPVFAKKSLGQNFLISDVVIQKIIDAAQSLQPQIIYEIGPGPGALTEVLLQFKKPLHLLELDSVFADYWRQKNIQVEEVDALQWNWLKIENPEQTILVSNLPYQISSSLVMDRSMDERPLKGMVLMFQKEVAQRLRAQPKTKEYGLLSVIAQSFWDMKIVSEAGSRDFQPAPKVASRVLAFKPLPKMNLHKKNFLSFVKCAFHQRRKLLKSNLQAWHPEQEWSQSWLQWLKETGKSPKLRAEELSPQEHMELFKKLSGDLYAHSRQ